MQFAIRFEPTGEVGGFYQGIYYIDVFDDLGNVTDGNNANVYYNEVFNGVTSGPFNIGIPGQSIKLYEGAVTGEDFNLSYILTGAYDVGIPSPPINSDLAILSIDILNKANTAGEQGVAKVYATSSFLPIAYYIDNVLKADPEISGITEGNHTIKVKDATDTEVEQVFYMPKLSGILQSDASLAHAGKVSRWNAAFNPVVFEFVRKDFDVTAITQDPTTLKPKVVINTDLTGLSVGDYVYLNAGVTNGESTYKGAYKVLDIVSISTIIIDTDFVDPDTISGFANIDILRPYYKIITRIKYVNPATGLFETIESTNRPIDGVTRADLSSFLQSLLKPQPDTSDYTAINYRDMGLAASYQISYAETWEGNEPVFVTVATPYYVTYAAMQLGQFGGGNMFDFVTQAGGTQLAKWLTDFIEPSYSNNYPFDLPFIYSEQIAGRQIYYKMQALDINRQPIGDGEYTSFLLNEDGSYLLNQDGSKFIIARQQLVNQPIVEHVGVNRLLVNQDFGPNCYYIAVQLFYDEDTVPVPVTTELIVKVDRVCPIQPVYLRWIGLNGGYNYFRFNYNQTKTLDVQNPVIVKDYVQDWQNSEGIERKISNDASDKMQLFADLLSKNDIDGLQSIKYSPIVQVLTNSNPIKWQTIILNASTFTEYDTQNEYYEFSITYNLPSKNIQTQ